MPQGYTVNGQIDVQWWVEAVNRGKRARDLYAKVDRWPTWRKWARGEWSAGILPSNIYFKMIHTLVPRTYFRNPSVSITQTKPGIEEMLLAKLLERADNKLIDLRGLKGQMKRAVLNATMFGTGFIRRGYGAEFSPTPEDLSTEGPDVGGKRLRMHVEYNDLVAGNQPWMLNAHPSAVIVPHDCADMHEARWVCYEATRSKDDLQKDPRFKNTSLLDDGANKGNTLLSRGAVRHKDGVLLWEIRDKKTRSVFVIAPYGGTRTAGSDDNKPLLWEDDKLQRNGRLPIYPLIFNPDDEQFWGVSDSIIIEPQQLEKNQVRTQIMYHRRIMLAKWLYQKGAITPDELSKLLSDSNVGIGVQVTDINGVKPIDAMNMPGGLVEMEALIDREVQEQLGLGVNQFGEYAPGSADRSATEANIVNQATAIRIDERRDTTADLLVNLVSDMNEDIFEYWTEDMVLDLVGPGGVPIWVKFNPELLQNGQYNIKVDPDSSVPLTKEYRAGLAVKTYEMFYGRNQSINPEELTRWTLNELHGVDADSVMASPVMQTSQQQPMPVQDVASHLQQLQQRTGQPAGNVVAMTQAGATR